MEQLFVLGYNVIAEASEPPNGCPRDNIRNRKLNCNCLSCREQTEPFQTAEVALDVQPVGDIPSCIVHNQYNRTQQFPARGVHKGNRPQIDMEQEKGPSSLLMRCVGCVLLLRPRISGTHETARLARSGHRR
jgi:hypothetical protein